MLLFQIKFNDGSFTQVYAISKVILEKILNMCNVLSIHELEQAHR